MDINWTLILPLIILQLLLQVVAIVDVIRNPNIEQQRKIIWIILLLLFSILGPVMYFIIERKDK